LVAARRSRTLLLIRSVVAAAEPDSLIRHAYAALGHIRRVAPDVVDRVLDHPTVGAWAVGAATRVAEHEPVMAEDLSCVAIAAAVRGRVAVTFPVPSMRRVPLPTLGTVLGPVAGEVDIRLEHDGGISLGPLARVPADHSANSEGWQAVPRIDVHSAGLDASFLLERWAPAESAVLRMSERVDLALWRDRIAEGWDLLVAGHRVVAEELATAVTMLSPLRGQANGMSSATATDAFGCLFLSLAPDAETVAVTLTHELQHTKLVALMDLFPLARTVRGELFYAPWRDDPRPIVGLLHGTYAFTGVTGFWRRQLMTGGPRELHAQVEFARWRAAAHAATRKLLDSDRLTPAGTAFVEGMAELLEQWCAEPVPDEARRLARQLAEEHRTRWESSQDS
jgi:HEXXH motif-containing protein